MDRAASFINAEDILWALIAPKKTELDLVNKKPDGSRSGPDCERIKKDPQESKRGKQAPAKVHGGARAHMSLAMEEKHAALQEVPQKGQNKVKTPLISYK